MKTSVIKWYLELTDASQFKPSRKSDVDLKVQKSEIPCPELNRFFYTAVGGDWFWIDRLNWTYDQWAEYVNRPDFETWIGYLNGTPVGYVEMERMEGGEVVEIKYFGLLPQFTGNGIGGKFLTFAVEHAFEWGAKRLWLNTCSLDGPHALANYLARGFQVYKEDIKTVDLPDRVPGPWPGARS